MVDLINGTTDFLSVCSQFHFYVWFVDCFFFFHTRYLSLSVYCGCFLVHSYFLAKKNAHKSHNNLTSAIKIRLNMRRLNGRKLLWKFSIFLCFYSDFKVIKVTQFNHCRKEILRDWIESLKLIKFAAVCVWGIEIYARVIGKFLHIEMHIFIILMPLFIIK